MFLLGVCRTKRFNLTSPKKTKGYPNQAGHEAMSNLAKAVHPKKMVLKEPQGGL